MRVVDGLPARGSLAVVRSWRAFLAAAWWAAAGVTKEAGTGVVDGGGGAEGPGGGVGSVLRLRGTKKG